MFPVMLFCGLALLFGAGCSGEEKAPDFQLNLSLPQTEGHTVTVNGGVVASVERIQWEWGDGQIDKHLFFPASHTYSAPGRYQINVKAFGGKNYTAAQSVTVEIK